MLLILVACSQGNEANSTATAATDTATATSTSAPNVPPPPVVVTVQNSPRYGQVLADGTGRSLYIFMKDKPAQGSACTGDCANEWPPLVASQQPNGGSGVDASKLGTIDRPDATKQVTYSGWPLYRNKDDKAPGDTKGEGVKGFGAEWYLISPAGTQIEKSGAKTGSS